MLLDTDCSITVHYYCDQAHNVSIFLREGYQLLTYSQFIDLPTGFSGQKLFCRYYLVSSDRIVWKLKFKEVKVKSRKFCK